MFVLFATKPLNDGTKGFRFNFCGKKGIVRFRKRRSAWHLGYRKGKCTNILEVYPLYISLEQKQNRFSLGRKLRHFAG
jgi:hypothetical protein